MSKVVVIIDNRFPFPIGESFLEGEINSGIYDNDMLYVIPLNKCKNAKIKNQYKKNMVVISAFAKSSFERLEAIIYSVMSTIFTQDIWLELKELQKKNRLSLKRLFSLLRFLLGSNAKYRCIEKRLRGLFCGEAEIFVYSYWMHQHAYIASKLKKKYKNIIFVSRCHGYDLYEERNAACYIPMRSRIFHYVDCIFPICKNGEEYLEKRYKEELYGKINMLYLGTYENGLAHTGESEKLKIVSCSNLIPLKRVDLIICALSLIKNTRICWTHFGDGELRDELEQLARNSLKGKVTFEFEGQIENSELMMRYKQEGFDLFINVSESEGLPVSIMEAMSFGIPTIATNVGGTSEIVQHGVNGFLLEKDFSVETLAELIDNFWSMGSQKICKMRENARNTWETKFNAEVNYREFYKRLSALSRGW